MKFFNYLILISILISCSKLLNEKTPKTDTYSDVKALNIKDSLVERNKIPLRKENQKYIFVNNIQIDIEGGDRKYYSQSLKDYNNNLEPRIGLNVSRSVEIDEPFLDFELNKTLNEKEFIDSNNKKQKRKSPSLAYLNLTLNSILLVKVTEKISKYENNNYHYVIINSTWEISNHYNQSIYSETNDIKSKLFVYDENNKNGSQLKPFKNAIEIGLSNFFQNEKFTKQLDNSDIEKELNYETILIPNPSKKVSKLAESIKASVTITNEEGHGSGFFITNEGHILTNYHVIIDTNNPKVVLNDGNEYEYEIIRTSTIQDLALIKIKHKNEFAYELSTQGIDLGSEIYAVGTPIGQDLQQSISKGIVSGLKIMDDNRKLMQTDASINGGNSGGAIILKNGMVVGVVSSKLVGVGIEGVAFGIPSTEVFEGLKIEFK